MFISPLPQKFAGKPKLNKPGDIIRIDGEPYGAIVKSMALEADELIVMQHANKVRGYQQQGIELAPKWNQFLEFTDTYFSTYCSPDKNVRRQAEKNLRECIERLYPKKFSPRELRESASLPNIKEASDDNTAKRRARSLSTHREGNAKPTKVSEPPIQSTSRDVVPVAQDLLVPKLSSSQSPDINASTPSSAGKPKSRRFGLPSSVTSAFKRPWRKK